LETEAVRSFVKEQIAYLRDNEVDAVDIADDQALTNDPGNAPAGALALDSLDQVELALAIETEFNVGTPEDLDFQRFETVNDIVEFVVSLLERKPEG
jgi:acyl carrier protein